MTSALTIHRGLDPEPGKALRARWLYFLAAGMLGLLWDLALMLLPPGDPLFEASAASGSEESLIIGAAFVLTSCVIALVFRRPIVAVRPTRLPLLATALMLLGSIVFIWTWMGISVVVAGEPLPRTVGVSGVVTLFVIGPFASLFIGWVTIPLAILSALLLRFVSRATRARPSEFPAAA